MPDPYQVLGTAVIVPTSTVLTWSGVVKDSVGLDTQAISGSASLTAGTYSPLGFINHCAKQLRISIYNAMAAIPAFFTILPATNTTIPLKIGLQTAGPSVALGATLLRIECATTGGALNSGNATEWQSFVLDNAPASAWGMLGLTRVSEERNLTVSAGGFADDGRFQPRWLFVFRSHFQESGPLRQWPAHTATVYDDGTVAQYQFGTRNVFENTLTLVDQPQHLIGPPWLVGHFSAFGATRNLLQLQTLTETYFTSSLSGTYKRTENLVSPAYLRCNGWWARYYQESPTDTFACFDTWPTSVVPTAGEPIQVMPESEALVEEIRRVGLLFRFDPVASSGMTAWVSQAYALRTGANPRPVRRAPGNLFYSVEIPLVLVPNPELTTP